MLQRELSLTAVVEGRKNRYRKVKIYTHTEAWTVRTGCWLHSLVIPSRILYAMNLRDICVCIILDLCVNNYMYITLPQ